jgi:hypothetical protein
MKKSQLNERGFCLRRQSKACYKFGLKTRERRNSMSYFVVIALLLILSGLASCNRDEKSSAERDKEVQRVLQEGAQREQKMYQGMQKGVENLEKAPEDQKSK